MTFNRRIIQWKIIVLLAKIIKVSNGLITKSPESRLKKLTLSDMVTG